MTDPNQQESLELFTSAWIKGVSDGSPDVKAASQILAANIEAAHDHADIYIRRTILAMQQYATEQPTAIDFMLQVYGEASKLLPEALKKENGSGPAAAFKQLKWWLVEGSDGFDDLRFLKEIGSLDPKDKSNLRFDNTDVDKDLPGVPERIPEWKERRVAWTIAAAMQARCSALEIVRDNGSHVQTLVDDALREHDGWSKAEFIGCCMLLRGCAKSLLDTLPTVAGGEKCEEWVDRFSSILVQEGPGSDDFLIKHHSAGCRSP
jgi:hypothetical protein